VRGRPWQLGGRTPLWSGLRVRPVAMHVMGQANHWSTSQKGHLSSRVSKQLPALFSPPCHPAPAGDHFSPAGDHPAPAGDHPAPFSSPKTPTLEHQPAHPPTDTLPTSLEQALYEGLPGWQAPRVVRRRAAQQRRQRALLHGLWLLGPEGLNLRPDRLLLCSSRSAAQPGIRESKEGA
jgi:hypothetical protein